MSDIILVCTLCHLPMKQAPSIHLSPLPSLLYLIKNFRMLLSNNLGKYDFILKNFIGVLYHIYCLYYYNFDYHDNGPVSRIIPIIHMILPLYLLPIHLVLLIYTTEPHHHPAGSAHGRFRSAHQSL